MKVYALKILNIYIMGYSMLTFSLTLSANSIQVSPPTIVTSRMPPGDDLFKLIIRYPMVTSNHGIIDSSITNGALGFQTGQQGSLHSLTTPHATPYPLR